MFLSMLIYQRKEHNVLVFSSSNFAEKDCCLSAADLYSSQFFDKKHWTKQRDLFLVGDQWRNVHIAVLPICLGIHLGRILKKIFYCLNLQDTLRRVWRRVGVGSKARRCRIPPQHNVDTLCSVWWPLIRVLLQGRRWSWQKLMHSCGRSAMKTKTRSSGTSGSCISTGASSSTSADFTNTDLASADLTNAT